MSLNSIILSCGAYLPSRIVNNHELAQRLDTSHEWIVERTGIHQRHIAAEGEYTSDLATAAAKQALDRAGVKASDVDLIVLATTTPDETLPAAATAVQAKLGAYNAFAFDVQAACSGFIYGLATTDNFLRTGQVKTALFICAETLSRITDQTDRGTAVLFGDGGAALLLRADDADKRGVLSTHLFSDGCQRDLIIATGGPSRSQVVGYMKMQGRTVMKQAVHKIGASVEIALEKHNLKSNEIDWFVPHQANIRIIDAVTEHFKLPKEKVVITIDRHANTSAASIPLALNEAYEDGRIQKDHLIVCEAMGAGLTWGSAVLKW